MKKIIMIILIIGLLIIVKIPKYVELNNLIIIDQIHVDCRDEYYLKFREVIPKRDNNDITYKYKQYSGKGNNYKDILLAAFNDKAYYVPSSVKIITKCSEEEINHLFNKKE